MNHKREGYYVVVEFTGEPETVAALDRMLGLADEVVRHKIVRLPEITRRPHRRGAAGRPGEEHTCRQTTASSWWGTSPVTPSCASPTPARPTSSFGLAVNRRWQNRQTQEWEEATSFFDVVCWREMAENVERDPHPRARVMVAGRLEQRSWETQDGDKRSKVEVVADEIGPSLRWATAQITKNERRGPSEGPRGGGARRRRPPAPAPQPAAEQRWLRIR